MSENKDNWNVYYCDDDSDLPKNEPQKIINLEENSPAENIPVSKYLRVESDYEETDEGLMIMTDMQILFLDFG